MGQREKWGEKNGARKMVREKSESGKVGHKFGREKWGKEKVGREKWGKEKSGARKVRREKWGEKSGA